MMTLYRCNFCSRVAFPEYHPFVVAGKTLAHARLPRTWRSFKPGCMDPTVLVCPNHTEIIGEG